MKKQSSTKASAAKAKNSKPSPKSSPKGASPLAGLLAGLGAADQGNDEDAWEKNWDARLAGLEAVLGTSADTVMHAVFPLAFGGNADVVIFPNFPGGVAYATADLTLSDVGQKKNSMGNFELMICSRHPEPALANLISTLAARSLKAKLEPGQILDLSRDKSAPVQAILFCEAEGYSRFQAGGQQFGLLLCLALGRDEAAAAKKNGWQTVVSARKKAGSFPFSEPHRTPFHDKPYWSDLPAKIESKDFKGAPVDFLAELSLSLAELRSKLDAHDRAWKLGSFAQWEFSQGTGALVFTLLDGSRAEAKGQIIGSHSTEDDSWEWAWNNPNVEKKVAKLSAAMKKHGQARSLEPFTKGRLSMSATGAWALAACTARHTKSSGVYRGSSGQISYFIAFEEPTISAQK